MYVNYFYVFIFMGKNDNVIKNSNVLKGFTVPKTGFNHFHAIINIFCEVKKDVEKSLQNYFF